ncbi:3-hydroxyisobutyryl-CoA hydrolase [Subtercola boreus]|uniref:3-hydroxyisobutyryl-CoA hydrolase n=1 Tax=Subtercola boreus TaxID=120213 RepID=A0A3E0VMY4_9MICO|nr:enoyl-CoA hydratase/isomerase family protein [Subtercola boreus]RFA10830.1 3-hydroxyisobutyryl-CoA hydrolase [Subtercola boreus]TQL55590.1 enoyl-CoA hydratase [Subtercola boreus]
MTGDVPEAAAVEPEVVFSRRGRLGEIALNRPRAINALTHGMVTLIQNQLDEWAGDPDVATVVLVGRGERGLCAGGDIVSLYHDATSGDGAASLAFWRDEYALNALIDGFPKPYVAFMDGIVLGGGIGVSAHGSHRIVTERSKLGLPETGIGFIPDVGATWLLARAPGRLGAHLALTAASVRAGDAIEVGLADSFVPSERLPDLLVALETTDADAAIALFADTPPDAELAADRGWIDAAYAADTVPGILANLRADPQNEKALATADTIEQKSPIAVAVTLESLDRVAALPDLEAALEQELRVSAHALLSHDFAEGVRAQVIDKDRNPHWEPRSASDVGQAQIDAYFTAVG